MATGGRKSHLQVMHEISANLTYASPLSGVMGVLPAGALMNQIRTQVPVGFNSTTNTLSIGTTPGGTNLVNAVSIAAAGRVDTPVPTALMGPLAADTPIYFTLASTGAAPTAGQVVAWLDYVPFVG